MTASAGLPAARERRRSLLVGGVIGVGLMAGLDQIVFHQILGWHHFYDRSNRGTALMSDGLLHAAELVILVAGLFWFAAIRRHDALAKRSVVAGLFLGLGTFQLWDGLVFHKVLRLHQVRYGVEALPYDVAWNAAGAILVLIGALLTWRSRDAQAGTSSARTT